MGAMLYDPRPHLSRCAAAWGRQLSTPTAEPAGAGLRPETDGRTPPATISDRLEDAPTRQEVARDER